MGRAPRLRAVGGPPGGSRALGLLRGPPDRQRPARAPPRLGPGLQGPLLPLPDDARLRRAAQGRLGHPRAAGRGRGREAARHHRQAPDRGGCRDRRVHPSLSRVGPQLRGRLADASPSASGTGSTSTTPTGRSRPSTSKRSGGTSSTSGTRGCSTRTSRWCRTVRGAGPRSAATSSASPTSTARSRTQSAYVLFPLRDEGQAAGRLRARLGRRHPRAGCPSSRGPPRPGRCSPTPVPRSGPSSSTRWSATSSWRRTSSDKFSARGSPVTKTVPGSDLVGLRYERPFDDLEVSDAEAASGWRVVPGELRRGGRGHRHRPPRPRVR